MNCPYCDSSQIHVVRTEKKINGYVVSRLRECDSCGLRFRTSEFYVEPRKETKHHAETSDGAGDS